MVNIYSCGSVDCMLASKRSPPRHIKYKIGSHLLGPCIWGPTSLCRPSSVTGGVASKLSFSLSSPVSSKHCPKMAQEKGHPSLSSSNQPTPSLSLYMTS